MSVWLTGMTANNYKVTKNIKYMDGDAWRTAYTCCGVRYGRHEWKIKVTNVNEDEEFPCATLVGISSNSNNELCSMIHPRRHFSWLSSALSTYSYAYSSEGIKNKYTADRKASSDVKYGEKFTKNDIITIRLNLQNNTISFSKNNTDFGIAYSHIKGGETYHLAVTMGDEESSIELISYINLSAIDGDPMDEDSIDENVIDEYKQNTNNTNKKKKKNKKANNTDEDVIDTKNDTNNTDKNKKIDIDQQLKQIGKKFKKQRAREKKRNNITHGNKSQTNKSKKRKREGNDDTKQNDDCKPPEKKFRSNPKLAAMFKK
eukprot:7516_1